MVAIKAKFDGQRIILPDEMPGIAPGDVILVFQDAGVADGERGAWLKAQQAAFADAWDNKEDSVYDAR